MLFELLLAIIDFRLKNRLSWQVEVTQLYKCSEGHSELYSLLCENYFGVGVFINGGDMLLF